MVFCGQCGFQLAPGETRCPRCGWIVDADAATAPTVQDYNPNAPTVESRSLNTRLSAPGASAQQKLVLHPTGPDYSTQPAFEEATRAAMPPANSTIDTPGSISQRTYYVDPATQHGATYTPDASYPGYGPGPSVDNYSGQYQSPRRSSTARLVSLIIILLGLLLILGAVALFALRQESSISHRHSNGGSAITATSTASVTATPSPAVVPPQAPALIQQYYADINRHDYRAAYNLWQNNPQSFIAFRNGFKNTLHDQIALGNATVQANGSVRIPVTVNVAEAAPAGVSHVVYQGYYIVGQQADGSWQILSGYLSRA